MSNITIKGAIDRLDGDGVVGWLYGAEFASHPIVQAFLHEDFIGDAVANGYRPDLEQVGFGDGLCGFEIRFSRPVLPSELAFVTIKPADVDLHIPLPNSAAGYLDLVQTLISDFPGAARNRSVLGGLWTDRTDSPQLLAGRVAVGAISAELQPALQEMILNGCVVLNNALAPNGVSSKDVANIEALVDLGAPKSEGESNPKVALNAISALLFREPVVRLLRAVLDDQPVVYRLDSLSGDQFFGQASSVEVLPSPGECLAIYVGHPDGTSQIEYLRDSHELPEFSAGGRSRWTSAGADELGRYAAEAGLSIETIDLDALDVVIVGPGLVHRVSAGSDTPVLRAIVAPRRVTPTKFLRGRGGWTEVGHVSGARIRL
jgi:hypothetical protein